MPFGQEGITDSSFGIEGVNDYDDGPGGGSPSVPKIRVDSTAVTVDSTAYTADATEA